LHHGELALVTDDLLRACVAANVTILLFNVVPYRAFDAWKLIQAAQMSRRSRASV